MSLWIEKKPNGTLIVPLPAIQGDLKGDGAIEVKPNQPDYQKYLKLYEDEQKRKLK